eukprot:185601_1
MTNALINIHVIISQVISCILCAILVFIVFSQTIYYLCIHKLLRSFYAKDESNLSNFQFPNDKNPSKSTAPVKHKYDDIHSFFRITTMISMVFCLVASVCSTISITDLLFTGSLPHHTKYIRFICFVSWLFSHYSMSSVFVGRLYVSFKDSIFQYSIHVIRILSISLASLPLLLLISFSFYMFGSLDISLVFFISFIAMDVAFSIILTSLFIQKLYQLIKGRILTGNDHEPPSRIIKSQSNPCDAHPSQLTVEISKKEDAVHVATVAPVTPQIDLPQIADYALPDFATSNETNDSDHPDPELKDADAIVYVNYVPHTQTDTVIKLPKARSTLTITEMMDDDLTVLPVDLLDTPRSTNSRTPKTVRFSNTTSKVVSEPDGSRAKRYIYRARSLSKSLSDPRRSMAFIKAKQKLDQQQLDLIDNMTRHGLLLCLSSMTSLSCLMYIMFTFKHYETIDDYRGGDDRINTVYYYLYWNMGIGAFLNGLSLYLSFAFAQWFYKKLCNRVHKWLEAVCTILIVKQMKQKQLEY